MAGQQQDGYWAALAAWSEALDTLWATQACPSPGGWNAVSEPSQGVVPRLNRVPWWARVWYHTPVLRRRASTWMWSHGGFDVIPRSVKLPAPPNPPPASAASVVLPLTGERVYLGEMRRWEPQPGLVHALGGGRVTTQGRRSLHQPWAEHVYGVRPTSAPVSVQFCRSSRWRFLRRSRQAAVVYGPQGVWAAEAVGRWKVVEVSHAGQTHRTEVSSRRPWRMRRSKWGSNIIVEP